MYYLILYINLLIIVKFYFSNNYKTIIIIILWNMLDNFEIKFIIIITSID